MSQNREQSHQLMTFAEAQAYLGIKSRKTLLKYIRDGLLPAFKLGGTRWRVRRSDMSAFIEENSTNGNGKNS